jgi:hypothetical protein
LNLSCIGNKTWSLKYGRPHTTNRLLQLINTTGVMFGQPELR